MTKKSLVEIACEIATVSAADAQKIAYIPKFMASTSLPTRKLEETEFIRRNGKYDLIILSPTKIGLPYGTYPRLIIIWLTTQSVITQRQEIMIGTSLADFMRKINKRSTGGKNGSLTALKAQIKRLFSASIMFIINENNEFRIDRAHITDHSSIFWKTDNNIDENSIIKLSSVFYNEIQRSAIPVDMRVIDAFSNYPLAIDIYCWLTYRYFILTINKVSCAQISWKQLMKQFGNSVKHKRHFIQKFKKAISQVYLLYPAATYVITQKSIILYRSPPHVPQQS